jgi:predicted Rossmann-fold nucleotide-binding protein
VTRRRIVIGAAQATPEQTAFAEELGRLLVEHGCRVLTSGLAYSRAAPRIQ